MHYTLKKKEREKELDFEDFELANSDPKGEDNQSANSNLKSA